MYNTLFIGAGSHSDAVLSCLNQNDYNLVGYLDDKDFSEYKGLPVLGKTNDYDKVIIEHNIERIMITIGDNKKRSDIFNKIKKNHYDKFFNIISESCEMLDSVNLVGRGIFIGHRTFIGADVKLYDNIIINTGSIVEHHTVIHNSCNITPGSVINGLVTLGEGVYVGSGSVIIQLIKVEPWIMLGAATTVTKDLTESNSLYLGTPAKYVKKIQQT